MRVPNTRKATEGTRPQNASVRTRVACKSMNKAAVNTPKFALKWSICDGREGFPETTYSAVSMKAEPHTPKTAPPRMPRGVERMNSVHRKWRERKKKYNPARMKKDAGKKWPANVPILKQEEKFQREIFLFFLFSTNKRSKKEDKERLLQAESKNTLRRGWPSCPSRLRFF